MSHSKENKDGELVHHSLWQTQLRVQPLQMLHKFVEMEVKAAKEPTIGRAERSVTDVQGQGIETERGEPTKYRTKHVEQQSMTVIDGNTSVQ